MPIAVLFDLYDTLIHLPSNRNPYLQLCRKVNCSNGLRESMIVEAPTLQDFCTYLGVEPPDDIVNLQTELEADILSAATFPNTISTLEMLKDKQMQIVVVSNVATPYKNAFYRLGLDQFVDSAVFSCEVGITKPNPKIYKAALTSIGVSAQDTIMVGDSKRSDVIGPSTCGIKGILIDRKESNPGEGVINTLKGVEKHLTQQI